MYEDIIDLPCPTSSRHPRMPRAERAAQFAPFAALTGYDDAIDETGRLTDEMVELSEEMKDVLDRKQGFLLSMIGNEPLISVTYFVPDIRKNGGIYKTVSGRLKTIDEYERLLILTNGTKIRLDMIYNIESEVFGGIFDV